MSDEPPSRIATEEPDERTLDELLAEPIVRLLMAGDHVEELFIREIAGSIRRGCGASWMPWLRSGRRDAPTSRGDARERSGPTDGNLPRA